MVKCVVTLLSQELFNTEVGKAAVGKDLFDSVKENQNLSEEADYFSISYKDPKDKTRRWLDMEKRIDKQLEGHQQPFQFEFELKFYPPVPENLNEDLTRYFIVLQIRKDLLMGRLPASFHTLAILGSYTVQGELGDYDRAQHYDIDYLRKYSFAPAQSDELLARIADLHKSHRGMTPAEADLYFLQNAKRLARYGMDMHRVKDAKGKYMYVGVAASGLYLYDEYLRMETFKWQRMLKMSYKGEHFLIKVRPGEYEKHDKTMALKLKDRKDAKRLLRIAVEHHQFFRLNQPEAIDSGTFGTFGSRRWRMSGRTQAQLKAAGTPKKDQYGRSESYMSQDPYLAGMGGGSGTLPLPGDRVRERDHLNQYGTYGGHRNEKLVTGYDDQGNPVGDYLNDSTTSREQGGTMYAPSGRQMYQSEDDLLNGRGYDAQTGLMTDAMTLDRNGTGLHMMPPNEYESYDDLKNQQLLAEQQREAELLAEQQQREAELLEEQRRQPQYPAGVGELPLPYFSSESAGVAINGNIDYSIVLDTHERSEKRLRERDTRLKNPRMTVDTNTDIDDQMLLDAILAVTGLDPRLCVDKIVIKTEEESS